MLLKVICITVLFISVFSLKFSIDIYPRQKTCFFQVLSSQQKYSMDIVPKSGSTYQVQVSSLNQTHWIAVFYKMANPYQEINVHKLAASSTTYSFCVKNIEDTPLKVQLNIQSGLQLMQFQLLPNQNDSENINRELSWIENMKNSLYESLTRMEGLRSASDGITNIMSTKMIGFAIIGLVSILVVNFMFYRQLKKTFKERKLI